MIRTVLRMICITRHFKQLLISQHFLPVVFPVESYSNCEEYDQLSDRNRLKVTLWGSGPTGKVIMGSLVQDWQSNYCHTCLVTHVMYKSFWNLWQILLLSSHHLILVILFKLLLHLCNKIQTDKEAILHSVFTEWGFPFLLKQAIIPKDQKYSVIL